MSPPSIPTLNKINPDCLLEGKVCLNWSSVGAPTYYVYRDVEPVKNVEGWFPYAIINEGKTDFEDNNVQKGQYLFYAVRAVRGTENSGLSNTVGIRIVVPKYLTVKSNEIQEGAYFESQSNHKYDEKVWTFARLTLIMEMSFPNRAWDYLETQVKSLKRDIPEFKGLLIEPTESQIRQKAAQVYDSHLHTMDLDWRISELQLILQKMYELIEFENQVRK